MPDRRRFIQYLGAATGSTLLSRAAPAAARAPQPALGFAGLRHGLDEHHHLPEGYVADVLLRWGDVVTGAPAPWAPPLEQAGEQSRRFGYNNDFIAYLPLPGGGSRHGLLCVNHEYTNPRFMWPGLNLLKLRAQMTRERTAVEMAAIGHSVVEIGLEGGRWRALRGRYNRRITMDTPVGLSGPAAGHARLVTRADPSGRRARGILNPCAGGKTPWGTVLVAEENFNFVFGGALASASERLNHARYLVGSQNGYPWWPAHFSRFDLAHEPHEPNRFGWVVEIDPFAPDTDPVKRTALGRFKHEAASCVLAADGRVVVYSGDDAQFEYLYRYVSREPYRPGEPAAHARLLDEGDLYVARFFDDGRLEWLRLRYGDGPLTPANGFHDQGEVLIETRRAADLLGATRLDRPEDVEASPVDGVVYAMLTNNTRRAADELDAANPRAHNHFGHVLRLLPPGAPGTGVDHAARSFRWEHFVLAGNPADPAHRADYPGRTGDGGWFVAPDNCAFDPAGRLWIASDQGRDWPRTGMADGLWATRRDASDRYDFRRFFRAPVGAEVCGPEFTPDGCTLFLAVQHPGVDGVPGGSYDAPGTRWPDFVSGQPPRPSVLAIRREDGAEIGS
ncbi:MAG: PhoX family protein [Gammaproteobacteria bacterium]